MELERTQDAEVVKDDAWELAVSEWYTGVSQELVGALRQMRAAAYVKRAYKRQGLEDFAKEVKAKKSKVYAYASTFERLAKAYGEEGVSGRLESSPLSPWQLVEAAHNGEKSGDVPAALDRAEDENLTTRELREERTPNVETVEIICCAKCGECYPLREAETRTEPA